ncbi:MAG: 23S rRNA pseudouridine(2605) synthase RluB [Gammaproteobacteria bacterium]|nr:23S rRNA pseudouridine(2605) synthase RluB [Gammaproteobacteria bacterium]
MKQRLQKVLANAGLGSRREIDAWIAAGRVVVNGIVAEPGLKVDTTDKILVDGKLLRLDQTTPTRTRVIAYNKPAGEVCTRSDPERRPTIFDHLPVLRQGRWLSVGRLDITTLGLLLLTNDGDLANKLMHPSSGIEREYAVRILGQVDQDMLQRLADGVQLDDGKAAFEDIRDAGGEGANHWYHVTLREGRNREVRRMWESQGVKVSRLIRVRYAAIELPRDLKPGAWLELEPAQVNDLKRLVGMTVKSLSHDKAPQQGEPRPRRRTARPSPGARRPRRRSE